MTGISCDEACNCTTYRAISAALTLLGVRCFFYSEEALFSKPSFKILAKPLCGSIAKRKCRLSQRPGPSRASVLHGDPTLHSTSNQTIQARVYSLKDALFDGLNCFKIKNFSRCARLQLRVTKAIWRDKKKSRDLGF